MKAKRWNYEAKKYDDYELPAGSSTTTDGVTVCACCGKTVSVTNAYSSKEIHNSHGYSYPVCVDCFDVECAKHQIYYGNY